MINTLLIVYICIQGNFSKLVNYLNPKTKRILQKKPLPQFLRKAY